MPIKGGQMKQILKDSSGYVKPNESVAIMGPSGSGKTSLLNIIAQRMRVSYGSKMTGEVLVNNQKLTKEQFGLISAYVQQDDVLVETMTPREQLTFACRMTTNKTESEVKMKVDSLILELGLTSCQNTKVGGHFLKGISGGEKKRTSMGYELITNPGLLLLDEPTSGLDSHTSLQIAKLIKY